MVIIDQLVPLFTGSHRERLQAGLRALVRCIMCLLVLVLEVAGHTGTRSNDCRRADIAEMLGMRGRLTGCTMEEPFPPLTATTTNWPMETVLANIKVKQTNQADCLVCYTNLHYICNVYLLTSLAQW